MIYFLRRSDGLVKIGTSRDFAARVERLEKSHGKLEVIRTINGDRRRERALHSAMLRHHEFGEWYRDGAELRSFIAGLDEGTYAEIAVDAARRAWREGEELTVREARGLGERLLLLRHQRTGHTEKRCIRDLALSYGFSVSFFVQLVKGRAVTISAWGHRAIRAAAIAEMEAARAELLGMLEAEAKKSEDEAGRIRLVVSNLNEEREADRLAALIAAKKERMK